MTRLPAASSTRPATAADLPAINDIFYQSEIAAAASLPPVQTLTIPDHVLATGAMYVAELAGAVVGYSGSIARGDVVYLTDLFVRPQQQSTHVAWMLLRQVLPRTADALSLGPIGVRDARDAASCVLAAVAWARARIDIVRLPLIVPHAVLAPLFDAHFRLVEVETFCCSSAPFFDPARYLPSGDDLL